MTKFESVISFAAVLLVVFVMLCVPALASGDPSGEPSMEPSSENTTMEPSGEVASCSSEEVLTSVLFEAAGVETSTNIEDILAGMDTEEMAAELCSILDMTQLMTDEQLRAQIISLAASYGYSFTDAELDAIVSVIRSFEPLTVDELQARLEQLREGYMAVEEIRDGLDSLGDRVQAFIQKLIELFRSIFGKNGALTIPM